ncbi:MAG TPA: M20/M25/M40 family metallo-hydrolase, partial [Tianweitania sediminis]|nr:M20/M25/M40 family metallo-hydrolase [Tianweitania sediminis]
MRLSEADLAAFTRAWAIKLTEFGSVSGSVGEAALGPWLATELAADEAFGDSRCWSFPVAVGDPRHCVAMLVRGSGRKTVILTGHYDTVTTEDYGALEPVATRPERLKEQLLERLSSGGAQTAAEQRALADLQSSNFLPGRGLLDMKAGLAAGLAACASFAADEQRVGNLLFLAVPDEEVNSVGARAAASLLPGIAQDLALDFVGAINLDAIADDQPDGANGRIIALGTIGKVLPTALVVGVHAHSGFPLAGINAGAIAGAIAARVEWAPELTDTDENGLPGTQPSLLSLRDSKTGYDVTTPALAFLTFNVLSSTQSPADVLDRFETLCGQAADAL